MAQTQAERKAETRARLLAAGADLFADRGIDGVSVDAVAEAAGRTSGAVYAHFGSKQGLLLAVLDAWKQSVLTVLFAEVAITDSPLGQLAAVWDNVGSNPGTDSDRWSLLEHELWLRAARDPEVAGALRARSAESRRRSGQELSRWASKVGVEPVAAPDALATLVKALLTGLEMQRRIEPDSVDGDLAVTGLAALMGMPRPPVESVEGRSATASRQRGNETSDVSRSPRSPRSPRHPAIPQREVTAVMNTEIRNKLGIEFPIFAFTHCRDVVAAVSNAGGIGVLGAIGFTPDQLEVELTWIDEHIGDHPYGVDIVIPAKYEGMDEMDPDALEAQIRGLVPPQHKEFALKILADHGVPLIPADERQPNGMIGWTAAHAAGLIDVALRHPKVKLIANALGTPPSDVVERIQGAGLMIGALAGSVKHALSHKAAGLDFIVCQGSEGGGHTGDVGSIVLWPEVIDAVSPIPVLAAGGVGSGRQMAAALALGAQGVWSGTLWLTVEEADIPPKQMETYLAASSRDTVRSRSFTGKPCRMLKNDWTEAWEAEDSPGPLPMPLQMMVAIEAVSRGHRYPEQARDVAFNPCGQVIGRATVVRKAKDVVFSMVEEYIEATDRMQAGVTV